jgi:inhibitor of cysteine peptidase
MKMKTPVVFFLLLATAIGAWPKTVVVPGRGDTLSAAVSDTVTVTLGGNPSTGYSWSVTSIDTAMVRPAGEPRFAGPHDRLGAPGIFSFDFVLLGKGTSVIALDYRRPWEKGRVPADSFSLVIICR